MVNHSFHILLFLEIFVNVDFFLFAVAMSFIEEVTQYLLFIAIALDETSILVAVHFSMNNITSYVI